MAVGPLPFKFLKNVLRAVEDSKSLQTLTIFSSKGLIGAFLFKYNSLIILLELWWYDLLKD